MRSSLSSTLRQARMQSLRQTLHEAIVWQASLWPNWWNSQGRNYYRDHRRIKNPHPIYWSRWRDWWPEGFNATEFGPGIILNSRALYQNHSHKSALKLHRETSLGLLLLKFFQYLPLMCYHHIKKIYRQPHDKSIAIGRESENPQIQFILREDKFFQ